MEAGRHLDGTDLIEEPGNLRRQVLETRVPLAHLTPRIQVSDVADSDQVEAATTFAADAVAAGHEGVVVKVDDAPYQMGRRGAGWIKVKPVHTLDLVILAVEPGNGRRRDWLSNLHLGARDPAGRFGPPGGFVMLGKTFKGLTDEMLRWQSAELPRRSLPARRLRWQLMCPRNLAYQPDVGPLTTGPASGPVVVGWAYAPAPPCPRPGRLVLRGQPGRDIR